MGFEEAEYVSLTKLHGEVSAEEFVLGAWLIANLAGSLVTSEVSFAQSRRETPTVDEPGLPGKLELDLLFLGDLVPEARL
jgi:hypothetical protein